MKPIQLISPVDGSVYAERMPLTRRGRQPPWSPAPVPRKALGPRGPLAERIALVKAGVAKLNEMKDRWLRKSPGKWAARPALAASLAA